MCSVNLEPCEVWRETPRMARKPHRCDACAAEIRPGDAYLVHFDIFEGEPSNEKACFACWWAREAFALDHGQSFQPSSLIEQLRGCIDYSGKEADEWRQVLAGVLARARRSPARVKRIRALAGVSDAR